MEKKEKNRDKWLPVRSQIHTKEHREKKILSKHRQASQIHTELMFLAQQADSDYITYLDAATQPKATAAAAETH